MSLIVIEPFYGGSHKVLLDQLIPQLKVEFQKVTVVTLSAKKWQWILGLKNEPVFQRMSNLDTRVKFLDFSSSFLQKIFKKSIFESARFAHPVARSSARRGRFFPLAHVFRFPSRRIPGHVSGVE